MPWTIDKARATYNVAHWGEGYFDINAKGQVDVSPDKKRPQCRIDLHELTQEIRDFGLSWPVLVRFTDILHDRVDTLCLAFDQAMANHRYRGSYTPVYPIKVNQQHTVVEHIRNHTDERVGLEAGSKPELLAVLGMATAGSVIICNGYKDREYIRLALIGRQMGHQIYIVIEKMSELNLILDEANKLGIEPLLGLRIRLASIGKGKWQNSGGEKAKFGFTSSQILTVIEQLRAAGKLNTLQLSHFHLGSQLANIRDIQKGLHEAARYYAELHRLGVDIRYFDIGGGLGVDYEGTRSRNFCSMNYSVQEYANNVVHALSDICNKNDLPHPVIISESGRALTAHHAVLITNVIDQDSKAPCADLIGPNNDEPQVIQHLGQLLNTLSNRSALETYHDAVHCLAEAQEMYIHGLLCLEDRARAEQFYYALCWQLRTLLNPSNRAQRELLDELNEKLANKYFCNFSLFQSLPDVWAFRQIFPILPLHRLDEEPLQRVIVEDLTCDSDGRIDQYVDNENIETTLPLHDLRPGEPYLIGVFMVGAYQEILGDLHNLFGDTDSVDVTLDDQGNYHLNNPEHGDTVEELLRYVHFKPEALTSSYKEKLTQCGLSGAQRQSYLKELSEGLAGYTYLEE